MSVIAIATSTARTGQRQSDEKICHIAWSLLRVGSGAL